MVVQCSAGGGKVGGRPGDRSALETHDDRGPGTGDRALKNANTSSAVGESVTEII